MLLIFVEKQISLGHTSLFSCATRIGPSEKALLLQATLQAMNNLKMKEQLRI